MGLRFDPMGQGQFKAAFQQIMEAESQPVRSLTAKKAKDEARMKLFQEFKGKFNGLDKTLIELAGFRKFRELKVDLGEGADLVSVTLDKDLAEPGKYEVQVDALATRTSIISTGLEDPDVPALGTGFIRMDLDDGTECEIFVDDKHASLKGVAGLINKESRSPIQAAVIKDSSDPDAPWKLILSAKKEGAVNQLEFPDFYFLDGIDGFRVDDDVEAENARISVGGFEIELESNDAKDFLPGVNLHLKQADSNRPFSLSISQDYQKISGKVKAAVDQLNQVLQFIVGQNSVDANSDTSTTFAGDSSLQNLEYQLRNLVHQGYGVVREGTQEADAVYLSQIGLEFDKKGQIEFKEDRFTKALENDFNLISQAISGPKGFAATAHALIANYTRPVNGLLAYKEQGIKTRIKDIDNQIEAKNRNLDRKKQNLTDQFARLQSTLGGMQRQQQYLSASLPGSGGGGNMVAQLLGG